MGETPPNGKGITTQEWVRDILNFLIKLVEANDKRYEERYQAQKEAITKAEVAQAGYNIGHNNLLADNRKQADEFSRKFEGLTTKDETTLRIAAITDRINVIDKAHIELVSQVTNHLQMPIHPGAHSQLDSIRASVKELQDTQLKVIGAQSQKTETKIDTRWIAAFVVTLFFSLAGFLIAIFNLLRSLVK